MNGHNDDTHAVLTEMLKHEERLAHLDLHEVRVGFILRIMRLIDIDAGFCELVERQLSLWCGTIDPRVFYSVCSEPKHLIRERMLAWHIDHTEE